MRSLLETSRKIVPFAAACLLAGALTVFVVGKTYFSAAWFHDRDMRGEDRVFLNDLVQKQHQEDVLDTDRIAAIQNTGKAAMVGSGNDPAPKAELVVNSQIVRRAELVVPSDSGKRTGPTQDRH